MSHDWQAVCLKNVSEGKTCKQKQSFPQPPIPNPQSPTPNPQPHIKMGLETFTTWTNGSGHKYAEKTWRQVGNK